MNRLEKMTEAQGDEAANFLITLMGLSDLPINEHNVRRLVELIYEEGVPSVEAVKLVFKEIAN